jgi:hypothetical protein
LTDSLSAAARPVRGLPSRWLALLVCVAAVGAGAGVLAHLTASHGSAAPLALPHLHGVASWSPGARSAPVFPVRSVSGVVSSNTLRGRTVVVAFEPAACKAGCASMRTVLAALLLRLAPADRPAVVTVGRPGVLSAVDPAAVRARFGVTGSIPLLYLLDRNGDERTGYLFPFAPSFVEGDLRTLAREGR